VIPGWTEGLQQVPEGSKFELYIPSDLAYGPGGTSGPIGPNQALKFEIELLEVAPSDENGEQGGEAASDDSDAAEQPAEASAEEQ